MLKSLIALLLLSCSAIAQMNPGTIATGTRVRKGFNPDIGVNLLGLYSKSSQPSDSPNGFRFQEAELQFTSNVDAYLRAVLLFSVHPDENPAASGFVIDPEETFIETTSLPVLTLKAGKFRAALGKHNQLHTHAYPFIDAPLAMQTLLGEEGLNDLGVSASALIPTAWFTELTAQLISGNDELIFNNASTEAFAGVAQLRSLWDLSDATTLEWGISGAQGRNKFQAVTTAYGSHLSIKWRPTQGGKYRSLGWTTEYLGASRRGNPDGEALGGLATWLQYQFAERWWVQGRSEIFGLPKPEAIGKAYKQSALLAFIPTEFSGYRIQYDLINTSGRTSEHRVAVQWNVSIGAHPAHAY